jgi:hypothetical protein
MTRVDSNLKENADVAANGNAKMLCRFRFHLFAASASIST